MNAKTEIKEINCDLSKLDSLEHFDISRNNLNNLPFLLVYIHLYYNRLDILI